MLVIRSRGRADCFDWADTLEPGYKIFDISVSDIEPTVDLARPFTMSLSVENPEGKVLYIGPTTFVRMKETVAQIVRADDHKANASAPKKVKCLVWDLDNTLWHGILLETNGGGMQLRDGVLSILKELDRRGILLSIASKNNAKDACKALNDLEIPDYFLVPQIGWSMKSAALEAIAEQLNIGIDSLAFIDDSPFELDEVKTRCPGVLCIHADEYLQILNKPEFAGDSSADGSDRRRFYQTELRRRKAYVAHGGDMDEFLAKCGIRVSIRRPTRDQVPRVHDIVQRTHQLNFSGNRYSLDEVERILEDPSLCTYVVGCTDIYGDYGLIGFCIADRVQDTILLRDLMLSCRVQGKKVEYAVIISIANRSFREGRNSIQARYKHTERNSQAGEVFTNLGFTPAGEVDGVTLLELRLQQPLQPIGYIMVEECD